MTIDEFLRLIDVDLEGARRSHSKWLFAVKMPTYNYSETKKTLQALADIGFSYPEMYDAWKVLTSENEIRAWNASRREYYLVDTSLRILSGSHSEKCKVIPYTDVLAITGEEDEEIGMGFSIDEVLKMIREVGGGVS